MALSAERDQVFRAIASLAAAELLVMNFET